MDFKFIDGEKTWHKLLKNDVIRNQIVAYIESVGGIKKARQKITLLTNSSYSSKNQEKFILNSQNLLITNLDLRPSSLLC